MRDRPLHLPLAYNGDGLISSADRRRFARIYNGACASGKGSRFHFPRLPETARAVDELRSEEGRPGEAPAGARPPTQAPLSPATWSEDVMGEAAVLGANALAQTALY